MKKFLLKSIISFAIVFFPACYFRVFVSPNASGDIGRLGMIPFGKEYEGLEVSWYQRLSNDDAKVIEVHSPDSLRFFHLITIGDSFSQFNENGYQYSLSKCLGYPVANFRCFSSIDIIENYLFLLNNGYIVENQTVILESVERSFVTRFSSLDPFETYISVPNFNTNDSDSVSKEENFINKYFSWIRLSAGYRNPIQSFSLSKELFTHHKFSSTLHIYNSKRIGDGDMLWSSIDKNTYEQAKLNIEKVLSLSEDKGVSLIIMIASDKYDAYEPWIIDAHEENPTMSEIPNDRRIYISRDCLRNAIENGTKDVYKLNNTHWSVVGADIVGNDLYDYITMSNLHP